MFLTLTLILMVNRKKRKHICQMNICCCFSKTEREEKWEKIKAFFHLDKKNKDIDSILQEIDLNNNTQMKLLLESAGVKESQEEVKNVENMEEGLLTCSSVSDSDSSANESTLPEGYTLETLSDTVSESADEQTLEEALSNFEEKEAENFDQVIQVKLQQVLLPKRELSVFKKELMDEFESAIKSAKNANLIGEKEEEEEWSIEENQHQGERTSLESTLSVESTKSSESVESIEKIEKEMLEEMNEELYGQSLKATEESLKATEESLKETPEVVITTTEKYGGGYWW